MDPQGKYMHLPPKIRLYNQNPHDMERPEVQRHRTTAPVLVCCCIAFCGQKCPTNDRRAINIAWRSSTRALFLPCAMIASAVGDYIVLFLDPTSHSPVSLADKFMYSHCEVWSGSHVGRLCEIYSFLFPIFCFHDTRTWSNLPAVSHCARPQPYGSGAQRLLLSWCASSKEMTAHTLVPPMLQMEP